MRSLATLILGMSAAAALPARAELAVTFDHPERYTDAALYGDRGTTARQPAIDGIRQLLERLGTRYLRPGQTLRIEVLDVDLAGRFEPLRRFSSDIRVMLPVTWPRIKVRYTLEDGGSARPAITETIVEQHYLSQAGSYLASDPLRYEKAMLEDWFRTRFAERRAARP